MRMQRLLFLYCQGGKAFMKKILLLAGIAVCMAACKRSTVERSGIVGKWKLTEYLADPGDGSGTWQPANPSPPSYLEFKNDGTMSSYTPPLQYAASHYRLTSDTTFTLIRGTDSIRQYYRINGANLTIEGGCIERCGERYVAVK